MREGRIRKLRLALACATTLAVTLAACSRSATVPVIVQFPNYDGLNGGFPDEDRRSEIQSYVLSIWKGTPGLCAVDAVGNNKRMEHITSRVYPANAEGFSISDLTGGRDQFVVLEGCRQPPEELVADPTLCDVVYRGSSVPGDYLAPGQTEPTGRKYDAVRLFFGRVGRFNPLKSRLTEGAFAGSTELTAGKFVFAGGVASIDPASEISSSVYLFDRDLLAFARGLEPMGYPRAFSTIAPIPKGGALISGGYSALDVEDDAIRYGEFTNRDGLPLGTSSRISMSPRAFAATAPISGGRVIVRGGMTGRDFVAALAPNQPIPREAEEWDESGVETFGLNTARIFLAGTPLADGRALFAGGISADFTTGQPNVSASADVISGGGSTTFTTISGMLQRWGHAVTLLPDGRALVTGGASTVPTLTGTSAGMSIANVTSADLFAIDAFEQQRSAVLKIPRAHHATAAFGNGDAIVTGGSRCAGALPGFVDLSNAMCAGESAKPMRSTEIFWHSASPAPVFVPGPDLMSARYGHSAFHLGDGTVLVAGGIGTNGFIVNLAEIYVPTWRCSVTTTTAFP